MIDLAKLRICFLAGCLGQGGAERQLYYILQSLRQVGAKPHLLCLTKGEYWEERIRQLGVPVTWVGQSVSRLRRLARIVSVLRRQKPDIIQSQHFFTNLYAVGAARLTRSCEIGAIRNDAFSEVRANGPLLGRLSLRAPRVLAANSRQGIRNAVHLGASASRVKHLPNVVDINAFQPSALPRPDNGFVRLLCVGRLVCQKRVDVFLEALSLLQQCLRMGIRATIAGDGPERADLEQRADELGLLAAVVEFRGAVANMTDVYQEADILVLTSDHEGTPNVLLEAMACGLPVVATRVGEVPEICQDGVTGYLVEPGDASGLADRVAELCLDPSLRTTFGRCARRHVLAHAAPNQLPRLLQELYEDALT